MAAFCAWFTCERVCCHERPIFNAAGVEHLTEPEGGLAQHDLGVLEALVVVCQREMDLLCDALDPLEQAIGLGDVAGLVLADAQLGHLLHELGVEEALVARLAWLAFASRASMALQVG